MDIGDPEAVAAFAVVVGAVSHAVRSWALRALAGGLRVAGNYALVYETPRLAKVLWWLATGVDMANAVGRRR